MGRFSDVVSGVSVSILLNIYRHHRPSARVVAGQTSYALSSPLPLPPSPSPFHDVENFTPLIFSSWSQSEDTIRMYVGYVPILMEFLSFPFQCTFLVQQWCWSQSEVTIRNSIRVGTYLMYVVWCWRCDKSRKKRRNLNTVFSIAMCPAVVKSVTLNPIITSDVTRPNGGIWGRNHQKKTTKA